MLWLSDELLYSSVYRSLIYYKIISRCTSFFTCGSQVWGSFSNMTPVPTADIFILHSEWYMLVDCEQDIPDILSFGLLWARGNIYELKPVQKTGTLGDRFFLMFMEPCITRCVFYITNEMQLIQCYLLLSAFYMFQAVFLPIIKSLWNCVCSLRYCHAFLLSTTGVDGSVPTRPHQHDNTQGCTYSFISSWWWAEKPPETCRALIIIKNTV